MAVFFVKLNFRIIIIWSFVIGNLNTFSKKVSFDHYRQNRTVGLFLLQKCFYNQCFWYLLLCVVFMISWYKIFTRVHSVESPPTLQRVFFAIHIQICRAWQQIIYDWIVPISNIHRILQHKIFPSFWQLGNALAISISMIYFH